MTSQASVDLHIHSSISLDGEYAPEDLVSLAEAEGVFLMAVADHNSTRAVGRALAAAVGCQVQIVPSIEMDCIHEGIDLHLLGYGIDDDDERYGQLEEEVDKNVRSIFLPTVEKLAQAGIVVDPERVLAASEGKPPCGELIADVLLAHDDTRSNPVMAPYLPGGARGDMPNINFYRDYCAQGKPAYVPIPYMSLAEAIALVRDTGGLPVIAHPGANLAGQLEVVDEILDAGVAGIEVYSSYHDPEMIAYFRAKAQQRNVVMTCGSDFHGKNKPLISIGDCYAGDDEETIRDAILPYAR